MKHIDCIKGLLHQPAILHNIKNARFAIDLDSSLDSMIILRIQQNHIILCWRACVLSRQE